MQKWFHPEFIYKQIFRHRPLVVPATGEQFRAALEYSQLARRKLESALFLVDFEIQNDILATVEAGYRTGSGFGAFLFRMEFVIGVGIQAAETVVAGVVGVTAAYGIGTHVFQKNNTSGKRVIGLVRHHAAHGAELSFALLILSHTKGCEQQQNHCQTADAAPHVHPMPPAVGRIRNTMLSSFPPVFASMLRVCSAKPFARTTIS